MVEHRICFITNEKLNLRKTHDIFFSSRTFKQPSNNEILSEFLSRNPEIPSQDLSSFKIEVFSKFELINDIRCNSLKNSQTK